MCERQTLSVRLHADHGVVRDAATPTPEQIRVLLLDLGNHVQVAVSAIRLLQRDLSVPERERVDVYVQEALTALEKVGGLRRRAFDGPCDSRPATTPSP